MCKCTPAIRTPYCGRGSCQWPDQTPLKRYKITGWVRITYSVDEIVTGYDSDSTVKQFLEKMERTGGEVNKYELNLSPTGSNRL